MKNIYILGCGGFAKEVYTLIKSIGGYEVKAFVDLKEKEDILFNKRAIPVISEDQLISIGNTQDVNLAIGLGDPVVIKKLALKFSDFNFPNLIHPTAVYDNEEVIFGHGNILTAGVIFTVSIHVGSFNIFNLSSTIGHDCKIENYNIINPSVNISGGVKIASGNLFGVGSIVLQNLTIGSNNVIGASALVTKDVEDDLTLVGVPAKKFLM